MSDISVGFQNLPIEDLASVLLTAQGPVDVTITDSLVPDDSGLIKIMDKFHRQLIANGDSLSVNNVTQFFWSFNPNNTNPPDGYPVPLPTNFQDFSELYVKFMLGIQPNKSLKAETQPTADMLARALLVMTQANLGIRSDLSLQVQTESTAFFGLGNGLDFSSSDTTKNYGNNATVVGLAGVNNLGNFGFPSVSAFLDELGKRAFAATIQHLSSTIENSTSTSFSPNFTEVLDSVNSYLVRFAFVQDYYRTFVAYSQGTSTDFRNEFFNFVTNALAATPSNTATFNSSQEFSTWLSNTAKNYLSALSGTAGISTSSVSGSFPKVKILQRIFALIVAMIGVIQRTTATQSDTLRIYTLQQSAMTNLVGKTHIFTSSDGSELADDTDPSAATLRDEQTQVTTAWGDKIRASRDKVKADAQSLQTNINNSNDAVNQQASMATSFIQELSTLLGAIYR